VCQGAGNENAERNHDERADDELEGAVLVLAMTVPSLAQNSAAQRSVAQRSLKVTEKRRTQRVVLVSIADRRLAVMENGNVLAYFPVAVGAVVSPSPTGEFEIVNRVANPAYYHEGVVVAASSDSPVGTRWIGLNLKGYGIHGTNAPGSIGRAASHGCIRLRNRDVERLYAMLRVGDLVSIRGERDEEIAAVFGGTVELADAHVPEETAGQ
jgi:lipoprotein-anchoring transpeptidase ErfK/SrfK